MLTGALRDDSPTSTYIRLHGAALIVGGAAGNIVVATLICVVCHFIELDARSTHHVVTLCGASLAATTHIGVQAFLILSGGLAFLISPRKAESPVVDAELALPDCATFF